MKDSTGRNLIRERHSDLLTDESRYVGGVPEELFFPESQSDIIEAVQSARSRHLPLTIIGGRTGIAAGAVPVEGCVAISLSSMNKIRRVVKNNGEDAFLLCDSGVMLSEIEVFLQDPGSFPDKVAGAECLSVGRYFYPPDPTEMTAQLGGTVATNASGARSYKYGPTRDHVQGVEVVLASGQTATISRGQYLFRDKEVKIRTDQGSDIKIAAPAFESVKVKNTAGYFARPGMDLLDLLIGSEGTLCIFSSVTIKLRKAQEFLSGLSFYPSRESAFDFADFLREQKQVVAIEYFDSSALDFLADHCGQSSVKLPAFPSGKHTGILWEFAENDPVAFEEIADTWEKELARCGTSFDDTWSGFDAKGLKLLKSFRHELPEQINATVGRNKTAYPSIRKISTDAAVPPANFRSAFNAQIKRIEKSGISYVTFGHLGDCHLHINLLPRNDKEFDEALAIYGEIMEIAINNGGSVSAEHGIGKIKKEYLKKMYGDTIINEMKAVKKAFDPEEILNPGNVFD